MSHPTLHTVNKEKFKKELEDRGWVLNIYGAWNTPSRKSNKQIQEDYIGAFLASVECVLEDRIKRNIAQLERDIQRRNNRDSTGQ